MAMLGYFQKLDYCKNVLILLQQGECLPKEDLSYNRSEFECCTHPDPHLLEAQIHSVHTSLSLIRLFQKFQNPYSYSHTRHTGVYEDLIMYDKHEVCHFLGYTCSIINPYKDSKFLMFYYQMLMIPRLYLLPFICGYCLPCTLYMFFHVYFTEDHMLDKFMFVLNM